MYFTLSDERPINAGALALRPVEADDAEAICSLYDDPVVLVALGKTAAPALEATRSSIEAIRSAWGSLSGGRLCLMFSVTIEGPVIGFTEVQLGYGTNGTALVGELTIVLTPTLRGHGHGTTVLRTLIDWTFERFPLLTEVWGACVPDNAASIALMESVGMEDCGEVTANEGRVVRKYRMTRPPRSGGSV